MEKQQLTLTCQVDSYRSGWTIVEFLSHRFPYHTAEGWTKRVEDEWVRVNGATVETSHAVAKNDAVEYTIWHHEPPVDDRYTVLFEDEHYLAVSKSGNIPVHACGIYIVNTLISRLRADYGAKINLAHRLDRETSGVVMLAKHRSANRLLAGMFERGEVEKQYLAIVYGRVSGGPGSTALIDAPIAKVDARYQYPVEYEYGKANDRATFLPKRIVGEGGKPARTRFEVTGTNLYEGHELTTLRVIPEHGRTNQIRVHLAHIGHPIVGDKIYALSGDIHEELLREGLTPRCRAELILDRHALHCESLRFVHPLTAQTLTIDAPVPDDLRALACGGSA
ncbi:MAG TPA: RluA family pseudouridine synthase [Candidatus Krumholzibacteria bacterium]|nr:RluA family pseudouridine synthase [Candidatus Krumholzibacteria bacterium]